MAKRLTSFSRFLITMLIIGTLGYGIWYFLNKTDAGRQIVDEAKKESKINPEELPLNDLFNGDGSQED